MVEKYVLELKKKAQALQSNIENKEREIKSLKLEAEKEILEKQVVEAEKVIQDLEKTNAFYVEKDTLFVGELENYKFFLQEVEAKIRNYHHRLKNKKTDQIATTISLADELRKVERRPSFSPRNSYLFDSPPSSSSSSPTRATSFSPSTYYNTRRKLSEVSEIDFST